MRAHGSACRGRAAPGRPPARLILPSLCDLRPIPAPLSWAHPQNLCEAAASSLGPDNSLAASMKRYLALTEASGALSAVLDGALLLLLDFISTSGERPG